MALAIGVAHTRALAGDGGALEVVTVDGFDWADRIAAIQRTSTPPGTAFRVLAIDRETRRAYACGGYALTLDAIGARALRLGACDPRDGSTEVVLIDRAALFSTGGSVAQPLAVGIDARAATAATVSAGVEFRCTAWVRPFVRDPQGGGVVYLSPGRYRLEPLDGHVQTSASREGWSLASTAGSAVAEASFRVLDRLDGREVVREHVSLSCRTGSAVRASQVPEPSAVHLPVGAVGRGTTEGAGQVQVACAGSQAPAVRWEYTAPYDGTFEFLAQGSFDVAMDVQDAAAQPVGCSTEDGVGTHARVVVRLSRGGQYTIRVGGEAGESGRYEVAVIPVRPDVDIQ